MQCPSSSSAASNVLHDMVMSLLKSIRSSEIPVVVGKEVMVVMLFENFHDLTFKVLSGWSDGAAVFGA